MFQALLNIVYANYVYYAFVDSKFDIASIKKPSILQSFKEITQIKPSLLLFLISLTFMTIGAINLSKYMDVYFNDLGYDPQQLGTFVFVTGIVSVIASVFIVPLFARFKKQIFAISVIQLLSAAIVFYVFRASNLKKLN